MIVKTSQNQQKRQGVPEKTVPKIILDFGQKKCAAFRHKRLNKKYGSEKGFEGCQRFRTPRKNKNKYGSEKGSEGCQ